MVDWIITVCLLLISYLLGGIPFGLLIGKIEGHDIRHEGSGNIGSTNALRVLGKKIAVLVFLCDMLKGAFIILVVYLLEILKVYEMPLVVSGEKLYILFGIAAILGHNFSPYLRFKGGKGVATSLGVLLAASPIAGLIATITFIVVVAISGYVSLGSTFASLAATLYAFIYYPIFKSQYIIPICIAFMAMLIIVRHISNYKRLIKGEENSFKKKKKTE